MRSLKNGGVRRYWSPYLYIYMFYVLCLCTVDGGRHKKIESFSKLLKIQGEKRTKEIPKTPIPPQKQIQVIWKLQHPRRNSGEKNFKRIPILQGNLLQLKQIIQNKVLLLLQHHCLQKKKDSKLDCLLKYLYLKREGGLGEESTPIPKWMLLTAIAKELQPPLGSHFYLLQDVKRCNANDKRFLP